MNSNLVKLGNGPDFVMTLGRMEIMHRISVRVFGIASRNQHVHTISHRSFHQCQMELYRFLDLRADGAAVKIAYFDKVTGNCRIQIGIDYCEIWPVFPHKMQPHNRRTLIEIFTADLNIFENSQTPRT